MYSNIFHIFHVFLTIHVVEGNTRYTPCYLQYWVPHWDSYSLVSSMNDVYNLQKTTVANRGIRGTVWEMKSSLMQCHMTFTKLSRSRKRLLAPRPRWMVCFLPARLELHSVYALYQQRVSPYVGRQQSRAALPVLIRADSGVFIPQPCAYFCHEHAKTHFSVLLFIQPQRQFGRICIPMWDLFEEDVLLLTVPSMTIRQCSASCCLILKIQLAYSSTSIIVFTGSTLSCQCLLATTFHVNPKLVRPNSLCPQLDTRCLLSGTSP